MSPRVHASWAAEPAESAGTDVLFASAYPQLRRLAARWMQGEAPGCTLQATALVHEAFLRLSGGASASWTEPRHFYAAAAEAMRRVMIDRVRANRRLKRGGDRERVPLDGDPIAAHVSDPESLLDLDTALGSLERCDARRAALVKLRFFAGLSLPQVAEALDISLATAERDWAFSRAWLHDRMHRGDDRA